MYMYEFVKISAMSLRVLYVLKTSFAFFDDALQKTCLPIYLIASLSNIFSKLPQGRRSVKLSA